MSKESRAYLESVAVDIAMNEGSSEFPDEYIAAEEAKELSDADLISFIELYRPYIF